MDRQTFNSGFLLIISAYIMWGLFPLYWVLLAEINSIHILAYRIVFSLFFVGGILIAGKNTTWLKFYKDRRKCLLMILAALTITFNWGLFIYAVNSGQTIEAALGYYINPLLSIVLGLLFFKEKFKALQVVAFGLAFVGVLILTVFTGRLPLISLGLAFSFGLYGLLKKTVKLSALESLGAETLIAAPLGILLLFTSFGASGEIGFPGLGGLEYWLTLPLFTLFMLMLSGIVTSIPLIIFSKGVKMIPLSTLGFIQFLSPTMSFIIGYFVFREYFPVQNFIAFGFIWSAAILYIISLKTAQRLSR